MVKRFRRHQSNAMYRPCLNPELNKHCKRTFMQEPETLNTNWIKQHLGITIFFFFSITTMSIITSKQSPYL